MRNWTWVVLCCVGLNVSAATSPSWEHVDKLIQDQRAQAAEDEVVVLLQRAKAQGLADEWTRALIQWTELEEGLHGYEKAVRWLKDQQWPEGKTNRFALNLFYAHALRAYSQAYGYEIGQRERVASDQTVDLKAWTREQIDGQVFATYLALWRDREALSETQVDALSRYITPSNYPKGIRSTLRDALSYFFAEFLFDSTTWRPDQANAVKLLDVRTLLAPDAPAATRLEDPEVHPVQKAVLVLADLEAWHRGRGERAGALEAFLTRAQGLFAHFTRDDEQEQVLLVLDRRVESDRSDPWFAMGESVLATLSQRYGALGNARNYARAGELAYPGSLGGEQCHREVAELEAPRYAIQGMFLDGARQRSLRVEHKNVAKLYFRAWRLDVESTLRAAKEYSPFPSVREYTERYAGKTPELTWETDLAPTPDLEYHKTYVTPPFSRNGLYFIAASARRDFGLANNEIQVTNLVVSDLVILTTPDGKGSGSVRVVRGTDGQPVPGADVDAWTFDWREGHRKSGHERTDADGRATLSLGGGYSLLVARHGDDVSVEPNPRGFPAASVRGEVSGALMYTDRSVYRPQQTLQWKVVLYGGPPSGAPLHVVVNGTATVKLRDANGQEVASAKVKTNGFGSAAGEFTIPAGRLLGAWSIGVEGASSSRVQVEEYKRPTFEVTLKDPEAALRLNTPATLRGEARYYFGLPVTTGKVQYRIVRQPVFPSWWGWFYAMPSAQPEVVGSGTSTLGADGSFHFTFKPTSDPRERADGVSYSFGVEADVTDEGGETRSTSRSFRLGFVAVEAFLELDSHFLSEGSPGAIHARRFDLDGAPRAGEASFRIVALQQPANALTPSEMPVPAPARKRLAGKGSPSPGDALAPRWESAPALERVMRGWKDGAEVASGKLTHDAKGLAEIPVPKLPGGAYRVHYATRDAFGAPYETTYDFVVAGKDPVLAAPIVLLPQKGSYEVGETARVLVHTGYAHAAVYLDLFRDGYLEERRTLQGGGGIVELKIRDSDRGGFSLTATAVTDHQLATMQMPVMVPWDDKMLSLQFATFRDLLRPGAKETFRVIVKGPDGKPVGAEAAEVLAYMYDRSLDIFAPHIPPWVFDLYPSRTRSESISANLSPWTASSIYQAHFNDLPTVRSLHGDQLRFVDGYGLGGFGWRGGPGVMAPMAMVMKKSVGDKRVVADMGVASPPPPPPSPAAQPAPSTAANAPMPAAAPAPEARTNFAESAFFKPQLLTQADGSVAFEFTVPDSVTSWNVWAHAITRDLKGGSVKQETRSIKPLLVRPYAPRFLREGDRADVKVVINSSADHPLKGNLKFEILDPETHASLKDAFELKKDSASFEVAPGKSASFSFSMRAPSRIGTVAFKVVAEAQGESDGELRPLPILPSRMHLQQSRFVTLKGGAARRIDLPDLAKVDDASRINESLVVTVDGQLFYQVLAALPYLVHYPYECTEQTLNRFLSTGIVGSLYREYPAVAKMALALSKRNTPLETFDAMDPIRKLTLEESPFLVQSQGGQTDPSADLVNVLKPQVVEAERAAALAKLAKAQTSSGGFSWWPGGPPSPFITLYLLSGFAKAKEFKIDVPDDMVQRAWGYLGRYFRDEVMSHLRNNTADYEYVTFLNFVIASDARAGGFTEADRMLMLNYSFAHWRKHAPYSKGLLALTLNRMGRHADAELVFESVMDSAKTTEDEGTFWAREDESWLWYNDTIESHAFALRALMELTPKDARKDGLVQWLFINKKLNQWKSTRATAEVLYSLVKYLQAEGELGKRETFTVKAGPAEKQFVFEPDTFSGKKQQLVIDGPKVEPAMSRIDVSKEGKGFGFASATWSFSTEKLPTEGHGDLFEVSRKYFKRVKGARDVSLQPIAEGATLLPGDELEVQLVIRAKHAAEYVHLRDPRGAGFEPTTLTSGYQYGTGLGYYEETRDSATNFFFDWVPVGQYTLRYRLRASMAGQFRVGPATLESMYAPEFKAYSAGAQLSIRGQ